MTILGVDVWEGNPNIDEVVLRDAGVVFMIIRLNDMNGGHHMDTNFLSQYAQAKNAGFVVIVYFVYNPWVDGVTNYNWLMAHLPIDARAVAFDIEVRYPNYPPSTYALQVNVFLQLVGTQLHHMIYTGAWFLPYLSAWPTNEPYWWARYPYALYPTNVQSITWAQLQALIDSVGWAPGSGIPGPCQFWQCTADRFILPGCGGSIVDINQFNGTLAELETFAGIEQLTLEQRVTILEREARKAGWDLE